VSATFAQIAMLAERLAATTRKLEKRTLMAVWLQSVAVQDAALGALYLAGRPFAETDERALNVGGALLSRALAELTGAGPEVMHAAYRRHGDLGAAAFDLLSGRRVEGSAITLTALAEMLGKIAAAQGPTGKRPLLLALLGGATALDAKYLIKLMLGDMRIGVQQSLVEEAVAAAFGAKPDAVRRAVMLNGSLDAVVRMAADGRLDEARMTLFHPLGFMLASPVASVEEALQRFAQEVTDELIGAEAVTKGVVDDPVLEALLEDKFDGMRAQLHCGDVAQPGRVGLFSRNRENIAASFPELIKAFAGVKRAAILDGEILAWLPGPGEAGRALPFSALQQRLGRKKVTAQTRKGTPVVFMAFDLLALDGELLIERSLGERRSALEALVADEAAGTRVGSEAHEVASAAQPSLFGSEPVATTDDEFARLRLSAVVRLKNAAQLDQAYTDARARGNEGVMLKAMGSRYQPGRRGLAWLKLKRELATLDVVVTAAEYGHGKRAGVLSDYTFAVRDGDVLRNVGKAYSGLTDAEIARLTEFFLDHTLEDFGSIRSVEPVLVLEVAFNNVMRSERHDSGFALRFPRILRIRDDKPVSEIDTLERVEEIYASQPDKPVEKDAVTDEGD
jgi:DNA ligase-1